MTVQQTSEDFLISPPGREPVRVEGLFRAPPERVFRAFTDPDDILFWFGPKNGSLVSAAVDLKVGGRWCFVVEETAEKKSRLEGEYLAVDVPDRLVFTWRHVQEFADGTRDATDVSKVTVTFTGVGKATEVKLRHEAIKSEDARRGVGGGWSDCFARLADLVTR